MTDKLPLFLPKHEQILEGEWLIHTKYWENDLSKADIAQKRTLLSWSSGFDPQFS
jgi:hypothetical protein